MGKENSYKELAKNTVVFAIGSFGSKVLSYLIVPLYSYYLTTEEYGRIDMFSTAISLLVPFTTMLIQESMLRFLMGKDIDESKVINNCFFVFEMGILFSLLISPLLNRIYKFDADIYLFLLLLVLNSFTRIFSEYFRAVSRNVAFTINGILVTIVLLCSNVIFLVGLRLGMKGYLYSMLLSQLCSSIYILVFSGIITELSFKKIDFSSLKIMLMFSIPLIPNTLMWWVMSGGDKFLINYYLGDSAHGIYSFAMKVPTIVSLMYTIFYQAWQMSAIEVSSNESKQIFYENVFKTTNGILSVMIAGVILLVKPVYVLAMSESFAVAWKYVPFLSIATFFSCCGSFFGVVYTVSLKSHKAFITTFVGAIVNLLFSLILIRKYELYGVAVGTSIGYIAVTLVRMRDAKKEIGMSFDAFRTIGAVITLICQATLTTLFQGIETYIFGLVSLCVICFLYRSEIIKVAIFVYKKLSN